MSVRQILDMNPSSVDYGKIGLQYMPSLVTPSSQISTQSTKFNIGGNSSISIGAPASFGVGPNMSVSFPASTNFNSIKSDITIVFNTLNVIFSDANIQANPPNILTMQCFLDINGTSNFKFMNDTTDTYATCNLKLIDPVAKSYYGSISYCDYFDYLAFNSIGFNILCGFVAPVCSVNSTSGANIPFTGSITSNLSNESIMNCYVTFTPCNNNNTIV